MQWGGPTAGGGAPGRPAPPGNNYAAPAYSQATSYGQPGMYGQPQQMPVYAGMPPQQQGWPMHQMPMQPGTWVVCTLVFWESSELGIESK